MTFVITGRSFSNDNLIREIEDADEFNQCKTLFFYFYTSQFQERWKKIILSLIEKKVNPCSKLIISKCSSRKQQHLAKTFLAILSQNFLEEIVIKEAGFTSPSWRALAPVFKKATRLQKVSLEFEYEDTSLDITNAILSVNNAPNIYSLAVYASSHSRFTDAYFHKIDFSGFENLTELVLSISKREHVQYLPELPRIPLLEKLTINDSCTYELDGYTDELVSLFVDELIYSRIVFLFISIYSFSYRFKPYLLEKVLRECEYLETFSIGYIRCWHDEQYLNALMCGMVYNTRIRTLRLPLLRKIYTLGEIRDLYRVLFSHPTLQRFSQILSFVHHEHVDIQNLITSIFIETGNTNIMEFEYFYSSNFYFHSEFNSDQMELNAKNFENRHTTLSSLLMPILDFFE